MSKQTVPHTCPKCQRALHVYKTEQGVDIGTCINPDCNRFSITRDVVILQGMTDETAEAYRADELAAQSAEAERRHAAYRADLEARYLAAYGKPMPKHW